MNPALWIAAALAAASAVGFVWPYLSPLLSTKPSSSPSTACPHDDVAKLIAYFRAAKYGKGIEHAIAVGKALYKCEPPAPSPVVPTPSPKASELDALLALLAQALAKK